MPLIPLSNETCLELVPLSLFLTLSLCIFSTIALPCRANVVYPTKTDLGYEPPDSLVPGRLRLAVIGGSLAYGAATYGLYQSWYRDYDSGKFHTVNDWASWQSMDKVGHSFTTWFESYFIYKGARWCGINEKSAAWTGAGTAMLFQTTVEVMDGFSEGWGFSWTDMAFNTIGAGTFLFQQLHWGEQRITLKFSAGYHTYDPTPIDPLNDDTPGLFSSRKKRAVDLFGHTYLERMLKDYNEQTYWASVNIASFIKRDSGFPKWLNIAAGYGAQNMYGASENRWTEETGASYAVDDVRLHSFYLSPDIDLRKIRTRSSFLRTVFEILNLIKIPLPTLEFRSDGKVRMHAIQF